MFFILRNWQRKRVLRKYRIDNAVWDAVVADTPVLARLTADDLHRLRELALLFLHEKAIEPASELQLDDTMRVRIAVLACLPILHLPEGLDLYDGFHSVIVYPEEFMVRDRHHVDEAGVVHTADEVLVGEAWEQGPVVLSWGDVANSGRGEGFNVVAHEFAHKLDALDGSVNGIPPLHRGMDGTDWSRVFQAAYDDLCRRVDADEETWLDPYAAENPGEFFAVATEMYFEDPLGLEAHHPEVYAQLVGYFRPR